MLAEKIETLCFKQKIMENWVVRVPTDESLEEEIYTKMSGIFGELGAKLTHTYTGSNGTLLFQIRCDENAISYLTDNNLITQKEKQGKWMISLN